MYRRRVIEMNNYLIKEVDRLNEIVLKLFLHERRILEVYQSNILFGIVAE